MKFLSTVITVALLGGSHLLCNAQLLSEFAGLKVNSSIEIFGVADKVTLEDRVAVGSISGSVLLRKCNVLSRQKANWSFQGTSLSVTFGGYLGNGAATSSAFASYGIPDGALIDPILDVSAGIDHDTGVSYTVNSKSTCVAEYTCTGTTIFNIRYDMIGLSPPGCGVPAAV